jgi:hypothetical protein
MNELLISDSLELESSIFVSMVVEALELQRDSWPLQILLN